MGVQTSVDYTPGLAIPGEPKGSDFSSRTRAAEVVMPNGVFACMGTDDGQCKLPTSSSEVALGLGVTRANVARTPGFPVPTTAGLYQIGDSAEVIHRGTVIVTVETAVVPGDPVYVRHTARLANTQLGAFRNDADTAAYVDYAALVSGARFLSTASAGELAELDLNLP